MTLKKIFLLLLTTIYLMPSQAQEKIIPIAQIPEPVKQFVLQHFEKSNIISAIKEKEVLNYELEIKLNDRTKLTFDKNNVLTEIESPGGIPLKLLNDTIYEIVRNNYPNQKITSWEKTKLGQKVELDNDVDLFFDNNGNFLRAGH
ncbi:MAG TPA: PepSY-like domain-containing protein [Bacteroidia bacterium]|jgi:hypothetical protein|nr:PepSY-like domain-containing protein [Bacteroidia bacterium]HMU18611.1 PepSY-like domain-containing protein [Bacteroidia bacterium]